MEVHIRGRDLRYGRPKSVVLSPAEIAEALDPAIAEIAEFIERAIEALPPETAAAVCQQGIHLAGGGALLDGLDRELQRRLGVPFVLSSEPMRCVVKGTTMVLERIEESAHLLLARTH